ncbi:hypothetical protein ABPG74_011029 [Tetrahymena malaccensis]
MNKLGQQKFNVSSSVRPFQINAPSNTPFIETRRGNIYQKLEITEEYQKEREIRENIKNELREYFQDDMILNPQKVDSLIKQIREKKWESLNEISPEFIIDIDKCELQPRQAQLQKLKQIFSTQNKDEIQQIENFLIRKYNASIESFKIEINYNITPKIGTYEKKLKFKTHLENPFTKDKKPYWHEYDLDYDFCHNGSMQSMSEEEEENEDSQQTQQSTNEYYYLQYILENDSENAKKSQELGNSSTIQECEENDLPGRAQKKDTEIDIRLNENKSKIRQPNQTNETTNKNLQKSDSNSHQVTKNKQNNQQTQIEKTVTLKDSKINKKRTFSDLNKKDFFSQGSSGSTKVSEGSIVQNEKSMQNQESKSRPANKSKELKDSMLNPKDQQIKEILQLKSDNKCQNGKSCSSNSQKLQVKEIFLINLVNFSFSVRCQIYFFLHRITQDTYKIQMQNRQALINPEI